jgi:hypothetical protein
MKIDDFELVPRPVPNEVSQVLQAWLQRRRLYNFVHYSVGVVGLVASVAAGSGLLSALSSMFAFMSTVCIAILAFSNPRKEYGKFARASRVLHMAVLRYQLRQIDLNDLLNAVEQGEKIIEKAESDDIPSAQQVRSALGSSRQSKKITTAPLM